MIGTRTPDQIASEVERLAGRGLLAAGTFLQSRIKEKLSVPAPRKRVYRSDGSYYWRATTRATPGAPPRKVSGRLRASVMVRQPSANRVQIGVFNLIYARPLETWMNHKYLAPVMREELSNLDRIIGDTFRFTRHV